MSCTAGPTTLLKYLQNRQLRVNNQFSIRSLSTNLSTKTTSSCWCIDVRSFSKSSKKHRKSWRFCLDLSMTLLGKISLMTRNQGIGANSPAWSIGLNKNITSTISSTLMAMIWEKSPLLRKISLVIQKLRSSPRSHLSARRLSGLHQLATLRESPASRMTVSQRRRYLLLMIAYSKSRRSPSALVEKIRTLHNASNAITTRIIADTWPLLKLILRKSNRIDALSVKMTIIETLWIVLGMTLMPLSLQTLGLSSVRRLIFVAMARLTTSEVDQIWARRKRPRRIAWSHPRMNS